MTTQGFDKAGLGLMLSSMAVPLANFKILVFATELGLPIVLPAHIIMPIQFFGAVAMGMFILLYILWKDTQRRTKEIES